MRKLAQIWFEVQEVQLPYLEKEADEPLTEKLQPWTACGMSSDRRQGSGSTLLAGAIAKTTTCGTDLKNRRFIKKNRLLGKK